MLKFLKKSIEEAFKKSCMNKCEDNYKFEGYFEFSRYDLKQGEELTRKLVKELTLRRIDQLSEVAIIAEQGSEDINKLVKNFKSCFEKNGKIINSLEKPCKQREDEDDPEITHFYYYFKGLDASRVSRNGMNLIIKPV